MIKHYLFIALLFSFCIQAEEQLKVLHLTFHKGCKQEFEKVAHELSLDLTTWFIPNLPPYYFDEQAKGNALYNIGHDRAERIWLSHKDYFETFDVILTSDTAPLARIFLQNGWTKPLLVWICNRFDYTDATSLDCDFPDPEFYELFSHAMSLRNVKMIAYTAFEHHYTKTKGVDTGNLTITPIGFNDLLDNAEVSCIPQDIIKSNTFFLPPYHNETIFMNLSEKCINLGIPAYCGRYNGPLNLKDFKGIIHLPYSWSNLALFENMQMGIPYFIPSIKFLHELLLQGKYFHPNASCLIHEELYKLSEWYSPENSAIFTYFDSWEDLQEKIAKGDYDEIRKQTLLHAHKKKETMLERWKAIFKGL